ncbi:MAG: hypothetical protein MUO62_14095, partial [Anaerolineales bacterium]|nr:hypothetical protein [Anaerolineales bacterium]
MIIHSPTLTKSDGEICIASQFELRKPLPHLPAEMWYRFPEKYQGFLSPRADGFAAAALLVAMYTGEDLEIRGPLSPKLAYGLFAYRDIFASWVPRVFTKIEIQFEQLEKSSRYEKPAGVATAFTGGVDSFYTLRSHLPANHPIPSARVSHGLFIRGLDTHMGDGASYQAAAAVYRGLFAELGLDLIMAVTNAYQFAALRIDWRWFCGAPLIGAAHFLSPLLASFYVPAGAPSYPGLTPFGIHPLTDHLLSSESLEIIHHG